MGTYLEDLDGHEGYGARRLPDGTLTATWAAATARFDAHVAACSCGWLGGEHGPNQDAYEAAVAEWEIDHARPLLAVTVPAEVADAVRAAEQSVAALAGERPQAARQALDDVGRWADRMQRRLDAQAPPALEGAVAEPLRRPPTRRRAIGR